MFGFRKKQPAPIAIAEVPKADLRGKSTKEIIEEIHESFYTEVDRLLHEAGISNTIETDKQFLIDKCTRLKALGFTNTAEVKEAEAEIKRMDDLKRDNEAKEVLIEAINYFSFRYPNYRFITEESVKKICQKYNLVYGKIDRYIGSVPDKNLKHIEDFKIVENDECFVYEETYSSPNINAEISLLKKYRSISEYNADRARMDSSGFRIERYHMSLEFGHRVIDMKCPLEIAAPLKDFNMSDAEVKDFKISKIEILDPVVLKPVIFKGQKHYLIVTAWGEEAGDEIVVNAVHN